MSRLTTLIFLMVCAFTANAQSTGDFLFSGGFDIVKTDYEKAFNKAQLGVEANYFLVRHVALGAGVDIWTSRETSFVMGVRWYPAEQFFVRFRGLIGANDAALGGGWSKALNDTWRVEALGDFYFNGGEFGIRAGVSYVFKKK
ncbi:MAG: hypothetical protein ACK5DD_04495 [Cyclobacteriaceae bacterium]